MEQGGWGAAATAASTALGTILLLLTIIGAALGYSIAGSGNDTLTSGLNDLSWVLTVLASFLAAMLVMASAFGLWRAGIISSALFTVGVAAIVLVLLGSTTWAHDAFWAPDGAYNRWITTIIGLTWLVVVSGLLAMRSPKVARERAAAATP